MQVYSILGKIVNKRSGMGISGLRVEIWDKDLLIDDFVGNDTTAHDGAFHIRFDDSVPFYKELFLDRKPDLYFKVFLGSKLLWSTEASVIWNLNKENSEIVIEIEPDITGETPMTDKNIVSEVTARSVLQATYTPRKPQSTDEPSKYPRGMEKVALFNRIAPMAEELDILIAQYTGANQPALDTVNIIQKAITETGKIDPWVSAKDFAFLDIVILSTIALDLIRLRQDLLATISTAYQLILQQFSARSTPSLSLLPTWNISPNLISAKTVLEWAIANNIEVGLASQAITLSKSLSINIDTLNPSLFLALSMRQIERLLLWAQAWIRNLQEEVIGYLHLERLSFAPAGIERGELVYSLPLAPGEEVNVKHREWSQTTEEFERIVTDYLEDFSEEGVTEKTELSQSVSSQAQHSSAFNTSVNTSGTSFGWSISASVGYNASKSANKSTQLTRNQTRELTSKASSRAKKEHKISFRVASARETEDETVQRIKNPFSDKAVRIDYFQLIRKWQVNLFRCDIRLTWDLIIPEPGEALISKLIEIDDIRRQLEQEFIFPLSLGANPEGYPILTDKNFRLEAGKYGAVISKGEEPDPETDEIIYNDFHDWLNEGGLKERFYQNRVEVPNGYEVVGVYIVNGVIHGEVLWVRTWMSTLYSYHNGIEENNYSKMKPSHILDGRTGTLNFSIFSHNIRHQDIAIHVICKRLPEFYESWRLNIFTIIRNAAQNNYYENRQKLKDRLTRLQEELGSQDALSLRKKEREEVMRIVLEEMHLSPAEDKYRKDPRVVKFLQQAIEWENMLYFLYPYFWSDPTKRLELDMQNLTNNSEYWEFKKYLDHPDSIHQDFLKAGASRVVLTIRPGFEDAFLAFQATGDITKTPPSPYLEIGQEFRNFAQTNYPGIPPANPITNYRLLLTWKQKKAWADMELIMSFLEKYLETFEEYPPALTDLEKVINENEPIPTIDPWLNPYIYTYPGNFGEYDLASFGADGKEGGEGEDADITSWAEASLIGTWYEYTPTSALDIAFNKDLPAS